MPSTVTGVWEAVSVEGRKAERKGGREERRRAMPVGKMLVAEKQWEDRKIWGE